MTIGSALLGYSEAGSSQQSLDPKLLRIPSVQRLHLGYQRLGFLSVLLVYHSLV